MAIDGNAVGLLSEERKTYRRYDKYGTSTDAQGTTTTTIEDQSILQESDKKDKDSGVATNWLNAEKKGLTLTSQNDFITYVIKDLEGFELLYPDPKQRLFIVQKGHSAYQTQVAQAAMKANKENEADPTPEYNDVLIDLRVGVDEDGTYSIQVPPSKQSLSNEEKLRKNLTAMGISADVQEAMLLVMAQKVAAAAAQFADTTAE